MDKAASIVSSLPFLRRIQIPHAHTETLTPRSPRPIRVSQQQQNNRWDGERHGKRARWGNKTQEGTYRHAFPSKGCRETERMEKEVSVTPCETGRRTPDGSEGHPNSESFQSQSWQRVCCKTQPAQAEPQKLRDRPSCHTRCLLGWEGSCEAATKQSGWRSTAPFLTCPGPGQGKDTRQHQEGLGKTARSHRQLVGRAAWQRGSYRSVLLLQYHPSSLKSTRRRVLFLEKCAGRSLFLHPFMSA